MTTLTAFAKFTLMWWAYLPGVVLHLHPNTSPFLQPVRDSFDVRVLVKCQGAELVAGPAALVEYDCVISIVGISPDKYCHRLAAPAMRGTAIVVASERAHHLGRVFVVGVFLGAFVVEPRRADFNRDCL